jgi:hypothetical protein
MSEESPKPPDGLETAGRRLWDSVEWPAAEWWQSCELWGRACMAFVKAPPGSELGSPLTMLREKHRTV